MSDYDESDAASDNYDDMLKAFWVATRDPDKDWDGISFWMLPDEEQKAIQIDMKKELEEEKAYREKVSDYYYNCM